MKKRGRNLAALAALAAMGAGMMGRRGIDLGASPEDIEPEELRAPYFQAGERRTAHPAEQRRVRKYLLEKQMPGVVMSGDAYPLMSGEGVPVRSGQYKKGGMVKAKGRGDGCCKKGHTKGRYI